MSPRTVRAELEFSVDGMTANGTGKVGRQPALDRQGPGRGQFHPRRHRSRKTKIPDADLGDLRPEGGHFAQARPTDLARPLSLPSCSPVEDECLSYRQSCRRSRRARLTCSREFKLKVVEFSPAQYLTLKQTLKDLEYDDRKAPVHGHLAEAVSRQPLGETGIPPPTRPVESNAKILESHKELEVIDAHTAVYRVQYSKRILTYAGKIREAEVKIDYNPSCQEARLIRGVVISKTGQRQEISKGEINVMDAGWNASAKRYTGGKILVANLPGRGHRLHHRGRVRNHHQRQALPRRVRGLPVAG